MIVFIREIPKFADQQDLRAFVTGGLRRRWLLPKLHKESIENCDILRIENMATQRFESHGLVYVEDGQAGQVLIKQLNGSRFGDREVEVRSYWKRDAQRERRRRLHEQTYLAIVDRRRRERRRQNLIVETI